MLNISSHIIIYSTKFLFRYLYVVGHDKNFVCNRLHDHTINGKRSENIDIRDKKSNLSLTEQFQFLSNVPNMHWSGPNIGFMQTLSVKCGKYLPVSMRNRYIYYSAQGEHKQAEQTLVKMDHVRTKPCNRLNPAKRQKLSTESPTVESSTPDVPVELGEMEAPDVSSMSQGLTLYTDFVRLLVESGRVAWRVIGQEEYVIAMNSCSENSGAFLPREFVHVKFNRTKSECSCSAFSDKETDSDSCMHRRFVEEEIIPRLDVLFMDDWQPNTPMEKLLQSCISDHETDICVLGPTDVERTVKFSVKDTCASVGFVHLTHHGQYIVCQTETCSVISVGSPLLGTKKRVHKLGEASKPNGLCPHLDTLHARQDVLKALLTTSVGKRKCETQHFDVERGIWIQLKSKSERSPELIRYGMYALYLTKFT